MIFSNYFLNTKGFRGEGIILMYHRICSDTDFKKKNQDYLSVSVSNFKDHLRYLKENYSIVSINDFLFGKKQASDKFQIVITFDDGYKDNLDLAIPILQEFNVPATIYITTRFPEEDTSMWWYELKEFIENRIEKLDFKFDNKNYSFTLNTKSKKEKSFNKIAKIIKSLNKLKQNELLSIITKTETRRKYDREVMNWTEIKEANRSPLITIGAHTHNHLSLKNLKTDECLEEIRKSKELLKNKLNDKIDHFSYPFGSKYDADEREFNIVEKLGFKSAVTTRVNILYKKNKFSLPRIYIGGNTKIRELKIKLSGMYFFFYKLKKKLFKKLNNN